MKKLVRTTGIHDRRFQNEVGNLLMLEHKNIVKLLGYCYHAEKKLVLATWFKLLGSCYHSDVPEKFLCYEYLSNGSLDNYIYGTVTQSLHNLFHCFVVGLFKYRIAGAAYIFQD